jgi:hypothetical protein
MNLQNGERVLFGPVDANLFIKDGFLGFGSMKRGSLYVTNLRIFLAGKSGMGNFAGLTQNGEGIDDVTNALKLSLSKNINIPLSEISEIKAANFAWLMKGIRIYGNGISEQGWRIIPNGNYLKLVQVFIDLSRWDDAVPKLLGISRHFGK